MEAVEGVSAGAIQARIDELEKRKVEFVAWANAEVTRFDARIDELRTLLAPAEQPQTEAVPDPALAKE